VNGLEPQEGLECSQPFLDSRRCIWRGPGLPCTQTLDAIEEVLGRTKTALVTGNSQGEGLPSKQEPPIIDLVMVQ
jgi:hypothetical protein